jgi:hypothetical protein
MNTAAPPVHPEPLATAAVAATAVLCENCGAPVSGRYCASCGQRLEPPLHSLWHFTKIATEDLTHADSRVWGTLAALLFRPGRLSAEFLAGRRARYLPPVRLYLVLSVVFFLWAAATQPGFRILQFDDTDASATSAAIATRAPPAASRALAAPPSSAPPVSAGHAERAAADRAGAVPTPDSRDLHCHFDLEGPWAATIGPPLLRACRRIEADNGRSLQDAFLHNLPRAMFLFLPLLAAAMMLMYWRPRHYYVEHLLLLVHNHAFVFLAVMLAWAAARLLPFAAGAVRFAMLLYIPWYAFRSMRVAYGQSRALTAVKLVAMSVFYLACGAVMVALTTLYSALML